MKGVMAQYARQFILPGDCDAGGLLVSPSSGSAQMCVRHIHRTIDVSSATLPAGFTCVMRPDLTAPGFVSSSVGVNVPAGGAGLVNASLDAKGLNAGLSELSPNHKALVWSNDDAENFIRLTDIADSGGIKHQGLTTLPGATTNIDLNYTFKNSAAITAYYKVAAGWVILGSRSGASGEVAQLHAVLPANTTAVAWSFTNGPLVSSANVHIGLTAELLQFSSASGDCLAPAFPRFILEQNITRGRVIAMSVLATNTSAQLVKGGNINVGRVPHSTGVFAAMADQISVLPENRRYQSGAEKGGYAWWMPSELDEMEPNAIDIVSKAYREADFLLVNVDWSSMAAATCTYRLQFDWVVEFYTPNQLFEKIQTPPITPEYGRLLHRLLMLDAATCNPDHMEQLKELLRSGINAASSVYGFYKDNEAAFDAVAAILTALAAAA